LLSAYQLYKIYEGKDNAKMQIQKSYILKNYPSSDYANYLKDPNYFTKKKEEELKEEKVYVEITPYHNYIQGFIYRKPTPEPVLTVRGAFPGFIFTQTDAILKGIDFR
jgi:hypothetical protein